MVPPRGRRGGGRVRGVSRRTTIPEAGEFRARWQRLDRSGRKRVRRAVNRGMACDNRGEAALAVVTARQQKVAWLVTWPVVALVVGLTSLGEGLAGAVVAALVGLVLYSPVAVWFHRCARRAEQRNLDVVHRRKRK